MDAWDMALLLPLPLNCKIRRMFNPAHPGTIIKETIKGLREETGRKLTIEEVATGLGATRKNSFGYYER